MVSSEYIKDQLQRLSKAFPNTCFKYGFDESVRTHVIEITPLEHFYKLDDLDQAWIPVSIDFMETFPSEEIVFISSDSPLTLETYSFSCNDQREGALISEFFEEFLINKVEVSFAESIFIEASDNSNDSGFSFAQQNKTKITEKPFEINNSYFDSEQFLMAA